jgi:hypothetical protein
MMGCGATRGRATLSHESRDVWRGITLSSNPVVTGEVGVSRPLSKFQASVGAYASCLMKKAGPASISLASDTCLELQRSNVWAELSQDWRSVALVIGVAYRPSRSNAQATLQLPSATESYVELSTAGTGLLSHKIAYYARLTHDVSSTRATFLQFRADAEPLILPLLYAISFRVAGELGLNVGAVTSTPTPSFADALFTQRGIAYGQVSAGLHVVVAKPDIRLFSDVTVQQSIDETATRVGPGKQERFSSLLRLGLAVNVPGAWRRAP